MFWHDTFRGYSAQFLLYLKNGTKLPHSLLLNLNKKLHALYRMFMLPMTFGNSQDAQFLHFALPNASS